MSNWVKVFVTSFLIVAQGAGAQTLGGLERATLLQLSVAIPSTGAAELKGAVVEETAKITSCTDGLNLADRLKARGLHGSLSFNVRTQVPLAGLPAPLRDSLRNQPVGRATPVFGGEEALRVLIRCEPTFAVPGQAPPQAPKQGRTRTST